MHDAQDSPENQRTTPAPFRRRLFWLLACAGLGLGIGLIGNYLSSNPKWFLALPAMVAVGWLFFANPDECLASCHKGDDGTSL